MSVLKPLWVCPRCGHAFASTNLSHSCGVYELDHHFRGSRAAQRPLFDALARTIESLGPVIIEPQKTRIVFTVRVRFAGVTVRAKSLDFHMWLGRAVEHPDLHIEVYGKAYVHRMKLTDATQLDAKIVDLLKEAYAIGNQEHRTK